MRNARYIFLIITMCLISAACIRTTPLNTFTTDDTIRLEIDGVPVMSYDESKCQLAYNEQRKEFRVMTDTMLEYFCITLSEIPASTGERATATVSWSTAEGERSRNDITLEAKRIKGDVIWLCDSSQHTAAVVRVLK